MFKLKNLPLTISLIVLISLIVGWGVSLVLAWTDPTANPPSDNVAAPINVSDTSQYKTGKAGFSTSGVDPNYGLTIGSNASYGIKSDKPIAVPDANGVYHFFEPASDGSSGLVLRTSVNQNEIFQVRSSGQAVRFAVYHADKTYVRDNLEIGGDIIAVDEICLDDGCKRNWSDVSSAGGWTDDGTVVRLTTSSDKVGVGTTNPGQKLEVYDGSIRISTAAGHAFKIDDRSASNYDIDMYSANGVFNIGKTAAADYLSIKDGGNVGIGTANPASKLHVYGTGTPFRVGTSGGNYPDLEFVIDTSTVGNGADVQIIATGNGGSGYLTNYIENWGGAFYWKFGSSGGPVTYLTLTTSGLTVNGNVSASNYPPNSCAAGSSIRAINADGTVTCETDDTGSGDADWEIGINYVRALENTVYGNRFVVNGKNTGMYEDGHIDAQGNIHSEGSITADVNVKATNSIRAMNDLIADDDLRVDGNATINGRILGVLTIEAKQYIYSKGQIKAEGGLWSNTTVLSQGNIRSGNSLEAVNNLKVGGNIIGNLSRAGGCAWSVNNTCPAGQYMAGYNNSSDQIYCCNPYGGSVSGPGGGPGDPGDPPQVPPI